MENDLYEKCIGIIQNAKILRANDQKMSLSDRGNHMIKSKYCHIEQHVSFNIAGNKFLA